MIKSLSMSFECLRYKPKRKKPRVPDWIMQYKRDEIFSIAGAVIAEAAAILLCLLGLMYLLIGDHLFAKILFGFGAVFMVMVFVCRAYADFWREEYENLLRIHNP